MRTPSRFVRKPSLLEQLYLDGAMIGYNITPRAYIRLDRAPCRSVVENALAWMAAQIPLLDLCYQNAVWNRTDSPIPLHWIESDCRDVMEVAIPHLDHRSHTLSLSVIQLKKSEQWYLCFSMFHGMGDGYTLNHMIYAFFAAADQQRIGEYDFSLTEHDFPQQTLKEHYNFPIALRCQPTEAGTPAPDFQVVRTVGAPYIPTALLCSQAQPALQCPRAVMVIPVNMRRYCAPGSHIHMGNLMAPMFLKTIGKSAAQIRSDIHNNATAAKLPIFSRRAAQLYRSIPGPLRRLCLRCYAASIRLIGRTPMAAMVSNVGKIYPDAMRCTAFSAEDCWYTFENIPLFAITLLTVSFGEHTNTCISTHYSRISGKAVETIARGLSQLNIYTPVGE